MTKKKSTTSPTWPEVVAEAWALRQEIDRRLLLLSVETARYERIRAQLDEEFAGQPLPTVTVKEKK